MAEPLHSRTAPRGQRKSPLVGELLEKLHQSPPDFGDERHAPPVNKERLRGLICREAGEAEARELYRLIHSFRSWNDAYTALLVEELSQCDDSESQPPI